MPDEPPSSAGPAGGDESGRWDAPRRAFLAADVTWSSAAEAWLGELVVASGHRISRRRAASPRRAGHAEAGGGAGFAVRGAADRMPPGPALADCAAQVWAEGLDRLDDEQLVGLLRAFRRLASWATAGELAVVSALAGLRADGDRRAAEQLDTEIAAALTLTGRAAAKLTELAAGLARLPGTAAALTAGRIDAPRAAVLVDETSMLDDATAAAVERRVLPRAPGQTTGQLRAACQRAVLAADPQAAVRRRKRAEQDARVEAWTETSGTAALAGRDLPPAEAIAADKRIDALARWLKKHGADGTLAQLRAKVFTALLAGRGPETLLPETLLPDAADAGDVGSSAPRPVPPGPSGPPGTRPGGPPDWPAGLSGSVHLTMPLTTWLGLGDQPGEAAGLGWLDSEAVRDLAARLAARRSSRWCVTLTSTDGRAVAHGCARAGPGPPGGDPVSWLAGIRISRLETGSCTHPRETSGYRPSLPLRHLIKVRDRTCSYPTCRRQAVRCDDDHTVAYEEGGRTCECNLAPLCRRHHRAKQAAGWRLSQPSPGSLLWDLPHGRSYRSVPGRYPAD